ncbi:MAG: Ig-like domain-containing protein, partial [Candidatus Nanopelagicaceae bacterium]
IWTRLGDITPPKVNTTYIGTKSRDEIITLKFSEPVKRGSNTKFDLYALNNPDDTTGATKVGTIDTAYFVFNGDSTVTFKPLNLSLTSHIYGETASNYAIKWKGADVQDLEGNSLGTDAYSAVWTTAPLLQDVSGVEPRVDTTWSPGSKRAGEDVILKFSEPVKLGPYTTTAGQAILVGSGVNTYFDMWNNDYMVFNGDNTVTIKPYNISGYVPGKTYTIKLPPVNILDLSNKTLNDLTSWSSYVTSQ